MHFGHLAREQPGEGLHQARFLQGRERCKIPHRIETLFLERLLPVGQIEAADVLEEAPYASRSWVISPDHGEQLDLAAR